MTKYLIVSAGGTSGRGARGLNLYWFLTKYHGRGAVGIVPPSSLKGASLECETLFIGLPTGLRPDDFRGVKYRRLALFDYQDSPEILLDDQTQFLSGLTNTYLKVWTETHWQVPWTLGVLPIRRQARLPIYLKWLAFKSLLGARAPEREWDVTFLGAPTGWEHGSQRVVWLREIKAAARHKFWGGLAASDKLNALVAGMGHDNSDVFYRGGRVAFSTFFDIMRRSKTVLTPMGNARWSYRHYEAIYAGAIPVSCDMRKTTVLIPLPLDGVVHVPDGAPVLDRIDEAIALTAKRPEMREANVAFLERYLEHGDYSRRKPELLERFVAQLPS